MEIRAASAIRITFRGLLDIGPYPNERALIGAAIRETEMGRANTAPSRWMAASYPVPDGIVYLALHRPSGFAAAAHSAVDLAGRIRRDYVRTGA